MKHNLSVRLAVGAALSALTIGAASAQDATPEVTPAAPETAPVNPTEQVQARAFLGVQIADTEEGVIVADVMPGSPAQMADLRAEDIITAFNGEAVTDAQSLADAIAALQPGDTATMEVTRDGETATLDVTLGETQQRPGRGQGGPGNPGRGNGGPGRNGGGFGMGGFLLQNGRLGVAFITLDAQTASENDVEQTEGALVTEVVANSPAAAAGVEANDVITAVNGEPVDAERTLRDRLIAYEPGDTVTLTLERTGEEQQIEVTLGQPEIGEGMMPGLEFMLPDGMELPPGMMPGDLQPDATPEMPAAGGANA